MSWQQRTQRPFHYKSIQWNEEGGGREEKWEHRDKEPALKEKKRIQPGRIVEGTAMRHGTGNLPLQFGDPPRLLMTVCLWSEHLFVNHQSTMASLNQNGSIPPASLRSCILQDGHRVSLFLSFSKLHVVVTHDRRRSPLERVGVSVKRQLSAVSFPRLICI